MARIKLPAGTSFGGMAFSSTDPNLLAVGVGGKVLIYNILNPNAPVATVQYLDGQTPISAVAFSQDGTKLVVGASKFILNKEAKTWTSGMVWNISIDKDKHTLTVKGAGVPLNFITRDPITQIIISKDVSIAGTGYTVTAMNAIGIQTLFSTGDGPYKEVTTADPTPVGQATWTPSAIGLSEQPAAGMAAWLAAGYTNGNLILYSREAKGGLADRVGTARYVAGALSKVLAVGFDPDTKNLAVLDINGMSIFQLDRSTTPVSLKKTVGLTKNAGGVNSAAVSTNAYYMFLGFKDGSVHVYWGVPPPGKGPVGAVVRPPDGGDPIILRS